MDFPAILRHVTRCLKVIDILLGPKSRKRNNIEPMASTLEVHPPTTPDTCMVITDCLTMIETEILPFILKLECARFFMEPTDPALFPGYYAIVNYPMDLGTIRARLENLYYIKAEQFENDSQLIAINAALYHDEGTEIHEAGKNLWKAYKAKQDDIPDVEFAKVIYVLDVPSRGAKLAGASKRGKRKSEVLDTPEVTGKRMAFTKALNALTKKW
ncbi:unnamed protein product [Orchesella dallaii]|uniref:Bromo domain-containing protein n=1 Tax=Orchesella dallaii TaxID=48710 RepID=A0ABP1R4S6_9HEXA